jgi:hypothetical protein
MFAPDPRRLVTPGYWQYCEDNIGAILQGQLSLAAGMAALRLMTNNIGKEFYSLSPSFLVVPAGRNSK